MSNETIVDRVVARLKAQPLGDLITEEDLHDIVKQAIPKTFFEPRRETTGSGYHQRTEEKPPLIVELMREALKDAAAKAVGDWMDEHPDQMAQFWKQVLDAGLVQYVEQFQRDMATQALRQSLGHFLEALNKDRMDRGLPIITPYL